MRKLLIILVAFVITVPALAQDQPTVAPEKNVFKMNTLSLILGTGSIFYEHRFSDLTSGQLGLAYMGARISDTKFRGFIITPEVRLYPKKNAIDGFYVAPYLRYQNYSLESGVDKGTLSSFGGGFLVGRQWIKKSGFTMDLFFGGHYGSTSVKVDSGTDSFNTDLISGFGVRAGFALGFAF
jgi:hypothetical protein